MAQHFSQLNLQGVSLTRRHMTKRKATYPTAFLVLLAAIGLVAVRLQAAAQVPAQPQVTFSKDIAPILQRSCQNCHRPGGYGPMPLVTYQQVRPWARAIRLKTGLREMPPWFIERNLGIQQFQEDPSLTDWEIARIGAWVEAGAPEGNRADLPPPRTFPETGAWTLGEPDLVVNSPLVTVKARAPDWYGDIGFTKTDLPEDRYIKWVEVKEFRPEEAGLRRAQGTRAEGGGDLNLFVVHHAQVSASCDYLGSSVCNPDDDLEAGGRRQVPGGGGEAALPRGEFSYLYEVGQNPMIYPDDIGIELPAGATIYFPNNHLHSIGREVQVHIQVGFKFHPKGFKPKYPRGLSGVPIRLTELDIPAGEENVRFDAYTILRHPAKMVTFEPHMHASGKRMCQEVIYPSGVREVLNCSGYNHNWVKAYVYAEDAAPLLPAGTLLHVSGWYDNSSKNPRNADPRNWKGVGQRSVDDMFFLLSKFVFYTEDEFKAEVAAREAAKRLGGTTAQR
jgi:hypothetical protein